MKKIITPFTLVFLLCVSVCADAQTNKQGKAFRVKHGNYRQPFYLPEAVASSSGSYKIERIVPAEGICISIIGKRDGDQFQITIAGFDKKTIMYQVFYMDGTVDKDNALNTWFTSYKKKQLNEFLKTYFNITIKKRKDFLQEYKRKIFKQSLPPEVSFFCRRETGHSQ